MEDEDTLKVCQELGLRCMRTDAFHLNGAKFDKGMGHEAALKNLAFNEFVLFLNTDMLLSRRFPVYMSNMKLDINKLYGCGRIEVVKPIHHELLAADQLCGPLSASD